MKFIRKYQYGGTTDLVNAAVRYSKQNRNPNAPISEQMRERSPNYRVASQRKYDMQQGYIDPKTGLATGKTEVTDSPLEYISGAGVAKGAMTIGKGIAQAGGRKAFQNFAKNVPKVLKEGVEVTASRPVARELQKQFGVKTAQNVRGAYKFADEIVDSSGKAFKPGDVVLEASSKVNIPLTKYITKGGKKGIKRALNRAGDESAAVSSKNPMFAKNANIVNVKGLSSGAKMYGGATKQGRKTTAFDNMKEYTGTAFKNLFQAPSNKVSAQYIYRRLGGGIHIDPKNKGTFTRYCKSLGFEGVTRECIKKGKNSKNPLTRKRATFAKNFAK